MEQNKVIQELKGQKIVGIKKATSKNGNRIYTTYFCLRPYSDYEIEKSSTEGVAVEEVHTSEDFPIKIGDTVKFYYGRAIGDYQPVTDYKLIESAK